MHEHLFPAITFLVVLIGLAAIWRSHARRTGEQLGAWQFLARFITSPLTLTPPPRPFDGRNGYPWVGADWVVVGAAFGLSMWWVQSGSVESALWTALALLGAAGIAAWRIKTGRTGEGLWRAGPQ